MDNQILEHQTDNLNIEGREAEAAKVEGAELKTQGPEGQGAEAAKQQGSETIAPKAEGQGTEAADPEAQRKARKRRARRRRARRKKKFSITNLILVLILLTGVGIMAYPTFSDWWNSFHQSRAIAGYVEKVAEMNEQDIDKMWTEAERYNAALRKKSNRFMMSEADKKEYNSILDVTGTGIMGYIDIPKIDVSLPIYHGTNEAVLQIAIGHIEGSSLPIGGIGTHAVLSGHRGLPSAKLFSDIDQLESGDRFVIQVLDRTMTYEVDQIRIVLPSELQDLEIDEKQDYVTLITCTPYGVNTHRLLVRGHRVANDNDGIRVVADAMQFEPIIVAPLVAAPILLVLLIMMLTNTSSRRRRRDREALVRAVVTERSREQRARRRQLRERSRRGQPDAGHDPPEDE
ncbi:MAG: class C sortase [Eubacterium sp.]|nr:class C sortase [Eubacterium sp.]